MSRPICPTCRTRNWPACNEALRRRNSLRIWFDRGMGCRADRQTWPPADPGSEPGVEGPLHLLIDCTDTGVKGEGERHTRKHGGPKWPSARFPEPMAKPWRVWRKVHPGWRRVRKQSGSVKFHKVSPFVPKGGLSCGVVARSG